MSKRKLFSLLQKSKLRFFFCLKAKKIGRNKKGKKKKSRCINFIHE